MTSMWELAASKMVLEGHGRKPATRRTYPMTAERVSKAHRGGFPSRNVLTTFECIRRVSTLVVRVSLETEDSPATGDARWFDAAAARGTEKGERKRIEVARRKAEENTLAVGRVVGGSTMVGAYGSLDVGLPAAAQRLKSN